MYAINSPLFCLTSDVDWASDDCVEDFVDLVTRNEVKPTIFATHASSALDDMQQADRVQVGLHPNFLPGSTHGDSAQSVIDHMFALFPHAETFRSHSYCDSSPILTAMAQRGIRYDSNVVTRMQPHLVPLTHPTGIVRFPVFFEDASWIRRPFDWNVESHLESFCSPGLKIINFHPLLVSLNVPDLSFYEQVKVHTRSLTRGMAEHLRYDGPGPRRFLIDLLAALRRLGHRFYSLRQLHEMLQTSSNASEAGRMTPHSDEEFHRYWSASDAERQAFIKATFSRRNAEDVYATSRDTHLRELEIDALSSQMPSSGRVLDLGCGNGYTILSLGERFPSNEFTGIDFSENLIQGARSLLASKGPSYEGKVEFLCEDAIEYVTKAPSESWDVCVTERFLLNLPSQATQFKVIEEMARILKPAGRLLILEGSSDGHARLNDAREAMGLDPIPANSKDNISALRFEDAALERHATSLGLHLHGKHGFSLYFLISRVLHPALVAPQAPRFQSRINELAVQLQRCQPREGGVGSNMLWVFEKSP